MSHILWYPGHERLLNGIVRAAGCHLFDEAGARYVDLESGVWCASVGHGHPRVLRVLAEQAGCVVHGGFNYSSPVVEDAAGEVLSLFGFGAGGRCVFLCSGSDAVEYGVRAARAAADRPLILAMSDSYFGAYGAAARRQEGEWSGFDWMRCSTGGGCTEGCPHWAEIPFDRVGAFLFEPGSSSGLVRFPPRGLVEAIVRNLRARGSVVLVNEVTTGVGRTGRWWGYEHYGLEPDVVAVGKGIGAGYPVSVAAFSPRMAARLASLPGGTVRFAQSHQNDPLGACVAREVIRVVREEGLVERGRAAGERLLAGLEAVRDRTGLVRDVRGRGLMLAVELHDDADQDRTGRVHRELVRRGFVVGRRPGVSVLRLDPPLTIAPADVDAFVRVFEEVLRGV